MINPLYDPFPETVRIAGVDYPVLTDFREWIRFSDLLHDKTIEHMEKLKLLLMWFSDEAPPLLDIEAVEALFSFYEASQLEPDPPEEDEEDEEGIDEDAAMKPPIFDWKIDSRFIIGDFRRYYGIDLVGIDYMHWWYFRCLFSALPDDSMCQKRMAYRSVNIGSIKDARERNRIAMIQRSIAIPYECNEDKIAEAFGGLMI